MHFTRCDPFDLAASADCISTAWAFAIILTPGASRRSTESNSQKLEPNNVRFLRSLGDIFYIMFENFCARKVSIG